MQITQHQADIFNEKCKKIKAHGFIHFLKNTKIENSSLLYIISELGANLHVSPSTPPPKLNITIDEMKALVIEFFYTLSNKLGDEVKALFTDGNPNYNINFINVPAKDHRSSGVGHRDHNTYIDFTLYLHGGIVMDDLITLAHESSHAISSHHLHDLELILNNSSQKEIDEYHSMRFQPEHDSVGEIESHIVEELFLEFLLKKKFVTTEFIDEYHNNKLLSMLNNINTVMEESSIISKLPCPITLNSLNALLNELQKDKNHTLIKRGERMFVDNPKCKHFFRYIIAQIVSDSWYELYLSADKKTKKEMIKTFEKYLNHTHEINIFRASEILLNNKLENTLMDYLQNLKTNNVSI